ncbi:DUF6233 domain-containing protein [Streptomyces mirabilis]
MHHTRHPPCLRPCLHSTHLLHPTLSNRIRTRETANPIASGSRIGNMFYDLPPDLARLLTLRVWHAMWLQRIDTKIVALQKREAEQEQGRKNRPQEPDWIIELGIGNGCPPIEVHVGGCYAAGKRRRPVPRDEARRLLTSSVRACTHPGLPPFAVQQLDLHRGPERLHHRVV